MCENINYLNESVKAMNDNSDDQPLQSILEDGLAKPLCGSEELRPQARGLGRTSFLNPNPPIEGVRLAS